MFACVSARQAGNEIKAVKPGNEQTSHLHSEALLIRNMMI